MNYDQIKFFLTIVKYNHFTYAANELYISQSNLSKQIKSLEKELGFKLFNRTNRRVEISDGGKEFYDFAIKALEDYEKMKSSVKKYTVDEEMNLTIGIIDLMSEYGLSNLLAEFSSKYPNIHIDIIERDNNEILRYLDSSKIGISFCSALNGYKNVFDIYNLVTDTTVIIASREHFLVNKKEVSLVDIFKEKFISLKAKSSMDDFFVNLFNNIGISPTILYIDSHINTLISLVAENIGITLLPYTVAKSFNNKNIATIKLKDHIESKIFLVSTRSRKLTKSEIIFKDFVIDWYRNNFSNS